MLLTDDSPSPDDVTEVSSSLLATTLPLTLAGDRCLSRNRWVLSPRYEDVPDVFTSARKAIEWFDSSAGVIQGSIQIALATEQYEMAWTLAEGMWSYLRQQRDFPLWLSVFENGLNAAQRCDIDAQARMLAGLGEAYIWMGMLPEAERLLSRSKALWVSCAHFWLFADERVAG